MATVEVPVSELVALRDGVGVHSCTCSATPLRAAIDALIVRVPWPVHMSAPGAYWPCCGQPQMPGDHVTTIIDDVTCRGGAG